MITPYKLPFWERVKSLLRAQKITQKELAALVNIKYSTMRFWLCYGYFPDVNTACNIASALGVSVEYLTKGAKHKPARKNEKKTLAIKNTATGIIKLARQIEKSCLPGELKTAR